MNTQINYLYRDAGNYKTYNSAIVCGQITKEQINTIIDCLDSGEYFIPDLVGLPEVRNYGYDPEIDHPYFKLSSDGFKVTGMEADCNMTVSELVLRFTTAKGAWHLNC